MQIIELNTDGTVNVYADEPFEIVVVDHVDDETMSISSVKTYYHSFLSKRVAIAIAKFALGHKE